MKILVLGDIHGHDSWKEAIKRESPDKIVFLGDYFDYFAKITPEEQVKNFKEILALKEEYQENCVLCLGNHDYSYMTNSHCSGYNWQTQKLLGNDILHLYEEEVLVPFHIEDNIIFSHAGISLTWIKDVCKCDTITSLKHLFSNPIEAVHLLDFNMISGYNPYGDTKSQSPLWIRPKSLLSDVIDGHLQAVGYTHTNVVTRQDNVWFCDSLPNSYLIIEDGRFIIKDIENDSNT